MAAKKLSPGLAVLSPRAVLFVANTTEFGGAERHLLELIRRLSRTGARSSILCLGPDFYTERLKSGAFVGVKVCHRDQPQSLRAWLQALREAEPDIIVFVCGWIWAFPWYAYCAARLVGARRVFWLVHLTPDPAPARIEGRSVWNLVRRVTGGHVRLRFAASLSQKIICVSNKIRDTLIMDYRFPTRNTITIYNGVAVADFTPSDSSRDKVRTRLGVRAEDYLFVCTARLTEVKRLDILLAALARSLRDGVNCKCIVVGDGPLRSQLSAQALALGLSSSVFFAGFAEDVRPYLQAADAFVLTSRQEGLPMSILEAMASGLPCVVTDVGGNAEAVRNWIVGIVVPPGEVEPVADAISYLVTHPNECVEMSRMARLRVSEEFEIEGRMAEIVHVLVS